MLGLSKKTDYGLLALSYLMHAKPGNAVRSKEIAVQYDIPVEMLAKILQKLARAGIVVSAPGPTGGYCLGREPAAISIAAVVEAIDGAPSLVHCGKVDHNACDQLSKCTIRDPLIQVSSRVFDMLRGIPLTELSASRPQPIEFVKSPSQPVVTSQTPI